MITDELLKVRMVILPSVFECYGYEWRWIVRFCQFWP